MSAFQPVIGGGILQFWLSPTIAWGANTYLGTNGSDGASATLTLVIPWIAPAPGVISDLAVQGIARQSSGGTIQVKLYRSASSVTPLYADAGLSADVLNTAGSGNDPVGSFTVAQGDMVVAFITGTWAGGQSVSALWTPTPTP